MRKKRVNIMPAKSEAQRKYLNAKFGHDWVKEHQASRPSEAQAEEEEETGLGLKIGKRRPAHQGDCRVRREHGKHLATAWTLSAGDRPSRRAGHGVLARERQPGGERAESWGTSVGIASGDMKGVRATQGQGRRPGRSELAPAPANFFASHNLTSTPFFVYYACG